MCDLNHQWEAIQDALVMVVYSGGAATSSRLDALGPSKLRRIDLVSMV